MKSKIGISILLAIALTWASINVVSIPWILQEEGSLIPFFTGIKKKLNERMLPNRFYDTNFIRNNFLIVNTTHDQELTAFDRRDKNRGPGIPITSRSKLTNLLRMLNTNDSLYDLIICDVVFELPSMSKTIDDSLRFYMNELQVKGKIIFGLGYTSATKSYDNHLFSSMKLEYSGATNKETVSGHFMRHRLTYNGASVLSLPMRLYAKEESIHVSPSNLPGLVRYTGPNHSGLYYNNFIPELFFDKAYFDRVFLEGEGTYDSSMVICDLGMITSDTTGLFVQSLLPKESRHRKNIFIGAMLGDHVDKHDTFYGKLDGVIVLLNTYHSLRIQQNKLNVWLWVISFLVFLLIAYKVVMGKEKETQMKSPLLSIIWRNIRDRAYYLLLGLLTFISFVVFNRATNLIVLIILIEALHGLVRFARHYRLVKAGIN